MLLQPVTWNSDERHTAKLLPWPHVCRLSCDWYSLLHSCFTLPWLP